MSMLIITCGVVVEKPYACGLFKNVQMQGAQKAEPRGVLSIYVERYGLQYNTVDERSPYPLGYFNSLSVSYFSSMQNLSIFSGGAIGYLPV